MEIRKITNVTQSSWHQGFLGDGHEASAILEGMSYVDTDPFLVFMDDRLDLPGGSPVGGPHPHAGIETLTLVLQGNGTDWANGSFEVMTAGKGIIHTEEITSEQKLHILQVWLVLPADKRWTQPSLQKLTLDDVPTIKTEQYEIRVYSGSSNGLTSPIQNHTPFTLADYQLNPDSRITQQIPGGYNGLVYVLEGALIIGDTAIKAGQTGWLNKTYTIGETELSFASGDQATRFVLYAGQPQKDPIVLHGPFVGDTKEDITRLYKEYRNGQMPHLNSLPDMYKVHYRQSPASNIAPEVLTK